jgi:hypothetical protein
MSIPDWEFLHPRMTLDHLGYIPFWLNDRDPDGAARQIHKAYSHGGGWHSATGFELQEGGVLKYPGDPPLKPLAKTKLRDETIYFYDHSWVSVVQPNGSFDVARID